MSFTISPPPTLARSTHSVMSACERSWSIGMPATLVKRGSGTMSSPWPPRRSEEMSSIEQPSFMARNVRKRATSSAPAWPRMRFVGKPETFHAV